ncbi:MAG: ABC transporter ATP-binding protein [Bergeyella sp.]|nr:ABC transporter ATP-binding protein [Bergeyella sp.]
MSSTVLSLKNISYKVNNKSILDNIHLTVNTGDSFSLIGKNGAGKTTLFEIILNDIKPSSGEVNFSNEIGRNFKNTGIVYDHLPLFPLMKVREIIDYFSSLYRIKPANIPLKYFEIFGLNEILNSFINTLSQGERKKVGLFLSIIHHPKFLILDEPFSNIDPTVIDSIWEILKENNRTILFTTHNWNEVMHVATKIAFLHKGAIVLPSTTPEMVLKSLPQLKKIITEYNENIIKRLELEGFDFYINENLLHIFYNENSNLIDIISNQTHNFSSKECDIKDAYLFKIKDHE